MKKLFNSYFLPILISIITTILSFFVNGYLNKGAQLSYNIDGPSSYLEPTSNSSSLIEVNGIKTQYLYGYKVHIWNSGKEPVENLRVYYRFENRGDQFKIFALTHKTIPKYQFGKITKFNENNDSVSYEYELINPDDDILANFLTNINFKLEIGIKSKGVKIIIPKETKHQQKIKKLIFLFGPSIIVLVISYLIFFMLRMKGYKSDLYFMLNPSAFYKKIDDRIDSITNSELEKVKKEFKERIEK